MFKLATLATLFAGATALCPGQERRPELPKDPSERGPWPVGSLVVEGITSRNLTIEVFYPGVIGSEAGRDTLTYDIREYLPTQDKDKIPDDDAPIQFSTSYAGLPLDESVGQFPVVVFVHGTAGWKGQSQQQQEHWASRGFVVVAATYPNINLLDMLRSTYLEPVLPRDQAGDARRIVEKFQNLDDPRLSMFRGFIDMRKLGMSGHSAGAGAIRDFGDVAKVLVPMATGSVVTGGAALESTLILGGAADGVAGGVNSIRNAFNRTPGKKRAAVQADIGHLFCTDICNIKEDEGGIVGLAIKYGIWQGLFFEPLGTDGCRFKNPDRFLAPAEGWYFTDYLSSAAFEETLLCEPDMAQAFDNFQGYEYLEAYFDETTDDVSSA